MAVVLRGVEQKIIKGVHFDILGAFMFYPVMILANPNICHGFERSISPVGPSRFSKELSLEVEELASVDVVIISHDHYDHFNKYSVLQLAKKTQQFIVPRGVGARLFNWGVPQKKIVELEWWQEFSLDDTLTIAATPAQHFSGRGLFDRNATLWSSWAIITPWHRLFFSGDSGYFDGFKEIGMKYGPFDMTLLECGAYDERWSKVHMLPEQTVMAHRDLAGKVLQPIHMATFNLAFHPWYEPMERLISEAWKEGVDVSLPVAGEVVDFHQRQHMGFWWQSAMERGKQKSKAAGGRVCKLSES